MFLTINCLFIYTGCSNFVDDLATFEMIKAKQRTYTASHLAGKGGSAFPATSHEDLW